MQRMLVHTGPELPDINRFLTDPYYVAKQPSLGSCMLSSFGTDCPRVYQNSAGGTCRCASTRLGPVGMDQ